MIKGLIIKMRRSKIISAIKKATGQFSPGTEVKLFGSEARKEAHRNSDVDLLILIKKDKVTIKDEEAIFSPLYQIELEYGILINPLILSHKEWNSRVTPFSETVNREGILL